MDNNQKFIFLADSLTEVLDKHSQEFRERNQKSVEELIKKQDFDAYSKIMAGAVMESIDVMKKWEKESFQEIGNITPEECFSSLETLDDILDVTEQFIDKNGSILPPSLAEAVSKLGENLKGQIAAAVDSIVLDQNGKLDLKGKAILKVVGMTAIAEFTDPLTRLLLKLDGSSVDDETMDYYMDAYKEIGEPSIQCLIAACEKSGHSGNIFMHSIITLGEIASKHRTEEIFRYIKECFRKSDIKLAAATALSYYGDGRAVTLLRSYLERNVYSMEETVYSTYRDIILKFGGTVSDLDNEYIASHRDEGK